MKVTKSIIMQDSMVKDINKYPTLDKDVNNFGSKVCEMIDTLDAMRKYTKVELANYFSIEECQLICEIFKGSSYPPGISPKMVITDCIERCCVVDEVDKKWNVDKYKLINKLDHLTEFQCYLVILNTQEFWEEETQNDQDRIRKIFIIR
ncbi:hypothetical protein [Clostridium sp.]|uniref:hypothetical protein n=1 Tax=Clostridium sp. TaxID=1506 RepID=UPI002FCCAD97